MFVALDLPEQPRANLAAWRDRLVAGRGDLRPVAEDALHVTLAFLGWQRERDLEAIAAAGFGAGAGVGVPVLRPAGLVAVPPRGAPRLFALDLEDAGGRASALQGAVAAALAGAGFYEPERRSFWPHITLARVKRGARAAPLQGPPAPAEPFEAGRLTLYRSTLRPQGALYEPLAGCPVGEAYR